MATKITLNRHKLHSARQLYESLTEQSNTAYYFFYGNHDPAITTIHDLDASLSNSIFDVYNNMIAGKRVSSTDVSLAVRNIAYVSNTIYDMYDDGDTLLDSKNFFVITNEGSYYHVYKCLDNNMDGYSTIQPSFAHISGSNSFIYQTSDGYRWKYMYSAADSDVLKFATSDYFPVVPNTTVEGLATKGSIDIVKIEGEGQRYDNYVTGTLTTSNIRVGGNAQLYEISNTTASLSNGFYTGCIMYLSTGTGAGQYKTVTNYISNTSGKYVVLANSFSTSPTNGTDYEIYPEVIIKGKGIDISNCVARALVNSLSTNSIHRVEILNRGAGYDYVYSANAIANAVVDVTYPAELRAINSPWNGHGVDAAKELGSNSLLISIKVSNTESNTIPAVNEFKQIGLLSDPLFANVSVEFKSKVGTFQPDEKMYQIKPHRVETAASVNTTSANVDCTGADFENQFNAGDWVYLKSSDALSHHLATISSVTNSSQIVLETNGLFACSTTWVHKANTYTEAYLYSANGTHVLLYDVLGTVTVDDVLIGNVSGAIIVANSTLISNVAKGFDTFIEMYKYTGILTAGAFEMNEYVYQTNTSINQNAHALVHSTIDEPGLYTIYTTKQDEEFRFGGTNTITGNTSGAVMNVLDKHPPELVYGSGTILFVENISPVTKTDITSETFQMILSY